MKKCDAWPISHNRRTRRLDISSIEGFDLGPKIDVLFAWLASKNKNRGQFSRTGKGLPFGSLVSTRHGLDNARAPGAICAASFDGRRFPHFEPPQLVGFAKTLEFVRSIHRDDRITLAATSRRSSLMRAACGPWIRSRLPSYLGLAAEFSLPIAPRSACPATTRQSGASSNAWPPPRTPNWPEWLKRDYS